MIFAPVVLFVYNRPEHTKKTVDALASNEHAADSDLWIFSDGAKCEDAVTRVAEVRKHISSLAVQRTFRRVTIVESPKNKGLANSIIQGVTMVLANADRAIILEDDLVTAPDFLKYMNDCLGYFQDKPVGAISGYSPIKKLPRDYLASVYTSKRNCSHGWATWRDRWHGADWEIRDFDRFRRNSVLRRDFDSTGSDRFDRLRRQVEGSIDSWSIRFGYHLFTRGWTVVYPASNRVRNIGFDGSGVHTESEHQFGFEKSINLCATPYKLSYPPEDARITSLFFELYSGSWISRAARMIRNANVVLSVRCAVKKRNFLFA